MYFFPKKDFVYALAIWNAPVVILVILLFFYSQTLLIIFFITIFLSSWLWNSTSYKIENGELFVKCWILKKRIKIKSILNIKKTKNIHSSYSLSTERLEITEETKSKFYVSPNDFDSFIKELKKYNSNISII